MPPFTRMQPIQHVFVLMLENHSFDHLLGFSGIEGTDAQTSGQTTIHGLTGNESNAYQGIAYKVSDPAGPDMPIDPGHEFPDTLQQLSGPAAHYQKNNPYPPIDNSGFVYNYVNSESPGEGKAPDNYGEIMKCFGAGQLPVLTSLAKEF